METTHHIYMDVCCLNRPFDDWRQSRIRIEAEAILEILAKCQQGQYSLISSTALEAEIAKTTDPVRQKRVRECLDMARSRITVTETIMTRAQAIARMGCKPFDALHVACAEFAQADVFLTTDDRLLRRTQANSSSLQVKTANPVSWLIEVSESSGET
jgi:predicted nucleic acid-binding protein